MAEKPHRIDKTVQHATEVFRERAGGRRRPIAALALAGALATTASCTGDRGRELHVSRPITAQLKITVVGDSLINRESSYIKTQATKAGMVPVLVEGFEGHSEVDGLAPSGMDLLTGTNAQSQQVQTAIRNSNWLEWGYGNNPLLGQVSAQAQMVQDTATVKAIRSINPAIRIAMPTLSTGDPSLGARFSERNLGREWASEDPTWGFYLVPVYEKEYGGDARRVGQNPNLHYSPIDSDTISHVHPQTPAGLAYAASIIIATAGEARQPSLTYVAQP